MPSPVESYLFVTFFAASYSKAALECIVCGMTLLYLEILAMNTKFICMFLYVLVNKVPMDKDQL